jgi:Tol biopolymer transport system component
LDLKTGKEILTFNGESPFLSVVSPNGTIIAGEKSGRVHFLRFERGNENWKQN